MVRAGRGWMTIIGLVTVAVTATAAGAAPVAPGDTPDGAAAEAGAPGAEAPPPEPARRDRTRSTDPGTPRGAAYSFLDACREGDYRAAARRLHLPPDVQPSEAPTLARHLMVVMDRKLWADFMELENVPEGDTADGEPHVDVVGTVEGTARGDIDIELERVENDAGELVWKFSSATVGAIPALYDEFGYGWVGEILPEPFFTVSLLEIELWQWLGLILLVIVAWVLSWLVVWLLVRLLRPVAARTETELDDRIVEIMTNPARLVLTVAFFATGGLALGLRKPVQELLGSLEIAAIVIAVTWFVARMVDVFAELVVERLNKQGRAEVTAVVPLGRRALKVVIFLLALLAMLQNLGFNVTGLVAGLGVGGLAFALAAQKSIENLFGGVTLIADQPVRVGDFCRFGGDKLGVVEDVGLRSTRVRTLDRTVVSIPNADFSQMALENFARRDRIRLTTIIGLRYETTPDQLRYVLAELRKLLLSHPHVQTETCRVRFVGFGAHSLDLEIWAYFLTTDWLAFLGMREDLFLRIMDIVDAAGTGFAFPSQTIYTASDEGLDRERSAAAEGKVRSWREEGTLPFPGFDESTSAGFHGTLDYPPEGSVLAARSENDQP